MELTSGIILALVGLVKKVLNFFTDWRKDKHEAQKMEELHEAKDDLEEAVEHGDLADLIDAANKLGEAKRK